MRAFFSVLSVVALVGCDSTGFGFRPKVTDVPAIKDLGELPVISAEDRPNEVYPGDLEGVYYGQLGAPADPAVTGGATFTFQGTGGDVCVVLDPEAVYWTRGVDDEDPGYIYDDNVVDDADLDLEGGLTAYYNGSPGVEIGDFDAIYTDDLGQDHELKFNECQQIGYGNTPNTHSGRGTAEWCTIDTDQRAGVSFTVVARTFKLPIEDSIADFAVGVFEGRCEGNSGAVGPDECFLRGEYDLGNSPEYFDELENEFCRSKDRLNTYCAEHLEDEKAPCFEHVQG